MTTQAPQINDTVLIRRRMKSGETVESFIVSWVEIGRDGNGWYVGMRPSGRPDSMSGAFGATDLPVMPRAFGVVEWSIAH